MAPRPPAKGEPQLKAIRMLDARVNYKSGYEKATAARATKAAAGLEEAKKDAAEIANAVNLLERTKPGIEVKLSAYTGGVEEIRSSTGALTPASSKSSEQIVRGYLQANADSFGFTGADLSDLVVLGDSPGGSSGLRMLRMEQQIDGRPVFQSQTRFIIDRNGRLVQGAGRLVPHAREFAGTVTDANYTLSAAQAVAALLALDAQTIDPAAVVTSSLGGHRVEMTLPGEYVGAPATARQVLFPLAPGLLIPAWSLQVTTTGDPAWYAIVDAQTGALLWRKNVRNYASAHDARFRVYVQADGVTPADSPAPASPNAFVVGGGTQATAIAPTIVSMHTAMDSAASPNGWIDDCPGGICTANETQTLGNNSLVCLDRSGTADVCDTAASSVLDGNGRPTGNPDANSRNRDFLGTTPRDFQTNFLPPPQGGNPEAGQTATGNGNNGTLAVDQFRRGSVTHLFYLTNWYHDKVFALGFDEASGNFQQTNFSGMGLGGDRVLGDAQDSSSTDNANFATFPDGTSGRMQMFRFIGPTLDRDGGLDAEVVLHELTHGTSNRLVGDAAGLNWDPASGMGEGWSDFFALSLLNNTNADDPNGRYASGGYATYKLQSGYLDNYIYGIRRFGYSTDNSVDPLTWADVDDVTNDMSGGIPVSPINFNGNGGMEVHNVGEVWALTLWEMRSRIIANPAGANGDVPTGNHTSLQLVTDGLKMTPLDPTFTDARDAILDADCATNACANEDSIWGAFADRELGYGAKSPYYLSWSFFSSHMAIHTSAALPYLDVVDPLTDVTIDDSADNNNGAIDPGEAIKISVELTNPWRGASKAVTSATATLTSSTPGVTIYDNTSTYGPIAPQGSATGDTFLFTVDSSVAAGTTLSFDLAVVSNLGATNTSFTIRVGTRNGTDAPVTYTVNSAVAIPDGNQLGAKSPLNVTDDFEIADLDFRVDSLTHTYDGDLNLMLRSPLAVGTDSIGLIGLLVSPDQFGSAGHNLTDMRIDDEATGDMFDAADATAPYTGSYLPIYNSPSWVTGFGIPGDPQGNLSYHDGTSTKGTWTVVAADHATPDNGTLNGWSMIVTPVHFDVTAFAPSALVSGTKTVSGTFQVGGTVTYTVVLTNNGTDGQGDNTGHEFTDVLPPSLTLVSAIATSGTASTAGNTANWDGSLAPLGGSVTITITATINAGTQGTIISNQGNASFDANNDDANDTFSATDDPSVGGASDPTTFLVASSAVTGTKTVSGTFTAGSTVTYTITLSNSGSAPSGDNSGNEFTDTLPAGVTLVSAIASSGTASTVGNTANWNGVVPAGGSVTITVTATVNSATPGTTISNQGTISFDADVDGTNDTTVSTDDPDVGGAADPTDFTVQGTTLAVTKTASGAFTVGSTVTYTITLTNSGTVASPDNSGDELTDVLPSSLTLVSASATSGTPLATVGTNTVTWTGSVPAAGSVTVTITATINAVPSGTPVSNQATVTSDSDLNGTNETTTLSDDPGVGGTTDPTVFVVGGATLAATKTVSGTFVPGSAIQYTITISNTGSVASLDNTGDELTDVLPASLTLVSANATSGTPVATVGTNTVTWTGSVPAGGSVTITINATINSGTAGNTVTNQATLNYDADANGANDTTTTSDDPDVGGTNDPTSFLVAGASVSGTKTESGSNVVGGAVTYSIVLTNNGNAATGDNGGHEFTDVLPSGLTLVSTTATSGIAVANVGTNTVTWDGALAAGASVTITINATINSGTAGTTITNQGTFTYDADGNSTNESSGTTDDPNVGGSADATGFVVAGVAVETLTKTVTGTFSTGGNVTYTLTINNSGSAASNDNPGNEITDVLPSSLTLVSASASSGTAVANVGTNTVIWNGSVPAGGSVTITIHATIEAGNEGSTISNQATLLYDSDGDGANETTVLSDSPAAGGAADPTTFTVAAAATAAIPTSSELGLLLLGLSLGVLAMLKIHRT